MSYANKEGIVKILQNYPIDCLRVWPFSCRTNQTYRPSVIDMDTDINKSVRH